MTRLNDQWLKAPTTQSLFRLFKEAGYQLLCVGGCVRNALLDQPVADIDMSTDAHPEQVVSTMEEAGLRVVQTGLAHGTVTVIVEDTPYEITTFRTDAQTDGRRATVSFGNSLEGDAARRDFTMNALYARADGTVLDPVSGLDDLHARKVRFIGDPAARIKEDYLRILRFFRFYAWYGDPADGIDEDGLAACAENADGIDILSQERIGGEMIKLLSAPDPAPAIASMAQSGILHRIMPGADAGALTVLIHLEDGYPIDWIRRATALGGEDLKQHWRLSNSDTNALSQARDDIQSQRSITEIAYRSGVDHGRNVALVRAALTQQQPEPGLEDVLKKSAKARFPVKAADLMPEYQGPELGQRLRVLEARWIESDFTLTRAELLS